MDYLYSLYDALVSINVPSDKARAVVDAMERDMGTTLATKQDLEGVRLATKQDLALLRQELKLDYEFLKKDLAGVRQELKQDLAGVRKELKQEIENNTKLLSQKIDSLRSDTSRDIAASELKMTVKLGTMMIAGFGLTIAAIRLWA